MSNRRILLAALSIVALAGVATAGVANGPKPWQIPGVGTLDVALLTPVIGQRRKQFSVTEMNAPAASTIRIVNDDDVIHALRITRPDGQRRDVSVQKPGDSSDIVLDGQGDHMVRCNIHPNMKLVVHVH